MNAKYTAILRTGAKQDYYATECDSPEHLNNLKPVRPSVVSLEKEGQLVRLAQLFPLHRLGFE